MERLNPEWQPWLRLLDRALRAVDDPVWAAVRPAPAADRPAAAPLLHGAVLAVDARAAARWVRKLLDIAATQLAPGGAPRRRSASRRPDALVLFEAAVAQDPQRMAALAMDAGMDANALAAVAQLAVRPLLLACGRRLGDRIAPTWAHGYCPVCGAWPVLAELRGLDRGRRLRCACCGGDWSWSVLHCPFCGEREHSRLGALVPDGHEVTRSVETCASCRGYIKAMTTLAAIPAPRVAVEDVKTVDLELAAIERGYRRPEGPGYAAVVRIEAMPGSAGFRIHDGLLTGRWRHA